MGDTPLECRVDAAIAQLATSDVTAQNKALEQLVALCKEGSSRAAHAAGGGYLEGRGGDVDEDTGEALLRMAATKGSAGAAIALALRLPDPTDCVTVLRYFADAGHPVASYNLGLCLVQGVGVTRDAARGLAYVRQAVRDGYWLAAVTLARWLLLGSVVAVDEKYALELLEHTAKEGCDKAALYLATCHFHGFGTRVNPAEGRAVLLRAAELGSPRARLRLAQRFYSEHQFEAAATHFERAENQGMPEATFYRGLIYLRGYLGRIESEKAADCLKNAFNNGFKLAAPYLARLYKKGIGVTPNAEKERYYKDNGFSVCEKLKNTVVKAEESQAKKAVDKLGALARCGDSDAVATLAQLHGMGRGVARDLDRAVTLIKRAALDGHPHACYEMACMNKGNHVLYRRYLEQAATQEHPKALCALAYLAMKDGEEEAAKRLYERAADLGYAKALFNLGVIYKRRGESRRSFELYVEASERGSIEAAYNVAWCYEHGKGVVLDLDKAKTYYKYPADYALRDENDQMLSIKIDAMLNLGNLYSVKLRLLDVDVAHHWYEQAANLGSTEAMRRLIDLLASGRHRNRDNVEKEIEMWQRKEAEAMANARATALDMEIARAGGAVLLEDDPVKPVVQRQGSYAPLYLSTSLRDVAFDIEELEQYALGRLRLLKAVESARQTALIAGAKSAEFKNLKTTVHALERQHDLFVPPRGARGHDDQLLKDEASHFLLRLALCASHEQRQWLLTAECTLFTARLVGATTEHILTAVKRCGGPRVSAVTRAHLDADGGRLGRELDEVARGVCRQKGGARGVKYYRVAFEQVPSLVGRRRVLMRDGDAYVPEGNVQDVVSGLYRSHLSQGLTVASRALGLAESDQRMRPILDSIRQHYSADEKGSSNFDENNPERINLQQLNESLPAMPLCMQHMIKRLRQNHHLRHAARMQLGVFLKGVGLTMEESLHFWKTEFGKGQIDSTKFDKQYSYNIRHYYGQEGKRKALSPFPCIKIINDRPGPAEYNGCPYREMNVDELTATLKQLNVSDDNIKRIAEKSKENNFQVACGMCFHATQPVAPDDEEMQSWIPSHPNDYFIQARKRRIAKRLGAAKRELIHDVKDEDMPMPDADQDQSQSQPDEVQQQPDAAQPVEPASQTESKDDRESRDEEESEAVKSKAVEEDVAMSGVESKAEEKDAAVNGAETKEKDESVE